MADALAPAAGDARTAAPATRSASRATTLKVVALAIVAIGCVADLVTKAQVQSSLGMDPDLPSSARSIEVIPGFFRLEGTWNPGITFGLASGGHTLAIKLFTMVACAAILGWLLATRSRSRLFHVALAMILGGAIGNLYDRFEWNKVRDFLLVYWKDPATWHWPAFNVADSLIVVGVILILGHELFGRRTVAPPAPAR
jgi:signal peptidase II